MEWMDRSMNNWLNLILLCSRCHQRVHPDMVWKTLPMVIKIMIERPDLVANWDLWQMMGNDEREKVREFGQKNRINMDFSFGDKMRFVRLARWVLGAMGKPYVLSDSREADVFGNGGVVDLVDYFFDYLWKSYEVDYGGKELMELAKRVDFPWIMRGKRITGWKPRGERYEDRYSRLDMWRIEMFGK